MTVPFSSRFTELDDLGTQVFAASLVFVGLAAVVLMTPAAYHRLTPNHDRHRRIKLGVAVTLAGMVLLSVAIACAVLVVMRFIFSSGTVPPVGALSVTTIGSVAAAIVSGTAVVLWFVVPLLRRERSGS